MSNPGTETHHELEHCEQCARDSWRAAVIDAAVNIAIQAADNDREFMELRHDAVRVLKRAFTADLLPKGLG